MDLLPLCELAGIDYMHSFWLSDPRFSARHPSDSRHLKPNFTTSETGRTRTILNTYRTR